VAGGDGAPRGGLGGGGGVKKKKPPRERPQVWGGRAGGFGPGAGGGCGRRARGGGGARGPGGAPPSVGRPSARPATPPPHPPPRASAPGDRHRAGCPGNVAGCSAGVLNRSGGGAAA